MKRSIIAAAVAVCLALMGVVAVLLYVQGADARAVAGKKAVRVLIATKSIPAGTTGEKIRSGGYVEQVTMPRDSVPADAMGTLDRSLDKLAVTSDLHARQVLLRGAFDQPSTLTGGLNLPDGTMAVSVQMSAPEQVAGYVRPGSQISVFDTFNADKSNTPNGERLQFNAGAEHVTRVLLPRVQVIAIGSMGTANAATTNGDAAQPSEAPSGRGATNNAGSNLLVTVAVSQLDAEKLVHAAQTGTLYLALLDDSAEVRADSGVNNKTLFS